MDNISLQTLTRSTTLELDKAITWQRSNEGAIDFATLINSRLKDPFRPVVSSEVEVFGQIDRVLRQRSGVSCKRHMGAIGCIESPINARP